eukprot:gnl/TRDRNA2_/TRDRNA2_177331_c14_seq1.p1 gnl/TRDRNA2_/TRDRNA2_177331_c14~~gnl/TRDRNA2_/TRDRNA2_177331_c14_seq1.p1  ORF type:complete len:243 (-),score=28.55 gnl/TRDRNA2_/TRDRNA2_177331_c14_seq1:49-777(-)
MSKYSSGVSGLRLLSTLSRMVVMAGPCTCSPPVSSVGDGSPAVANAHPMRTDAAKTPKSGIVAVELDVAQATAAGSVNPAIRYTAAFAKIAHERTLDCAALANAQVVLASAYMLKSWARCAVVLASARNKAPFAYPAVANAHVMFAKFCALQSFNCASAAAARLANMGASFQLRVAKAQMVLATSCALNALSHSSTALVSAMSNFWHRCWTVANAHAMLTTCRGVMSLSRRSATAAKDAKNL